MTDSARTAKPQSGAGSIDFDDLMRKYDTEARFRLFTGWRAIFRTPLVDVLWGLPVFFLDYASPRCRKMFFNCILIITDTYG